MRPQFKPWYNEKAVEKVKAMQILSIFTHLMKILLGKCNDGTVHYDSL